MPDHNKKQVAVTTTPEDNIITRLEKQGYTRQEIHELVHKLILLQIAEKKKRRHNKYLRPFYSVRHFLNLVKGKALSMLRSQFAKKPKQPV